MRAAAWSLQAWLAGPAVPITRNLLLEGWPACPTSALQVTKLQEDCRCCVQGACQSAELIAPWGYRNSISIQGHAADDMSPPAAPGSSDMHVWRVAVGSAG